MSEQAKTALSVAVVILIAAAFWLLLLAPKREEATKLSEQATTLRSEVSSEQSRAAAALVAKKNFPQYYEQLLLTGKAVPAEAATPSLLVQLDGIGLASHTEFESISASGEGGSSSESPEGSESLLPLNASAGPAGLAAMPYALSFQGGFFDVANFIEGIDSLVKTKNGEVDAHGRLITIDGFNLVPDEESESSSDSLNASFSVTTYVTPPGQGLTAGATPAGPVTSPATTPDLP